MRWILLVLALVFVSGCVESSETTKLKTCDEFIAEIPIIIAKAQNSSVAEVTRVIDGDTIELANLDKVRLIGINSPEKNEHYYVEAKENLEGTILGEQVYLQKDVSDKDKYGRYLRYIFTTDKFVNAEQVSSGLASSYEYFPDTKYQSLFNCLEKEAKSRGIGIWAGSGLYDFAVRIFQNPDDSSEPNLEYIALTNKGSAVNMSGWKLKDEATHIYTFGNVELGKGQSLVIYSGSGTDFENTLYWNSKTTVWNNDGDTVFLRDDKGNLALNYAY